MSEDIDPAHAPSENDNEGQEWESYYELLDDFIAVVV